jgi:hypothetical protein
MADCRRISILFSGVVQFGFTFQARLDARGALHHAVSDTPAWISPASYQNDLILQSEGGF